MKKKLHKVKKKWIVVGVVAASFALAGPALAEEHVPSIDDASVSATVKENDVVSAREETRTSSVTDLKEVKEQDSKGETEGSWQEKGTEESKGASEERTPEVKEAFSSTEGKGDSVSNKEVALSGESKLDNAEKTNVSSSPFRRAVRSVADDAETSSLSIPMPPKEPVSVSVSQKTLTINYNREIPQNGKLLFAVWGEEKGQNDLVWYAASNAGSAYIDLSKHKEYGAYHIHTYLNQSGKMVGLHATSIQVPRPDVKVAIHKVNQGVFDVVVSNVPSSISSVVVPVWTQKNGQDDIKWYATKQTEGVFKVSVKTSDHHSEFGLYNVHVYGHSLITGGMVGLAATSGYQNVDNRSNAAVSISGYSENRTSFTVNVEGTSASKEIKGVRIAAWSEKNGQDDIRWYIPSVTKNRVSQVISIKELSNTSDNYIVHVYTDYSDGTVVGTDLGTYKITKPTSRNTVTADLTKDGILVSLDSNVVTDYTKVKFAIWSSKNDQDDIKWYGANNVGTALASYSNHSGYGKYHIHTYLFENGRALGLNATTISINPAAEAKVEYKEKNTYVVTVSNVSEAISEVIVPVWSSKNDQDDIVWYTANRQANGTYQATLDLSKHKYNIGNYHAHVYGRSKLADKGLVGLTTTTFEVRDIYISEPAKYSLGQMVEIQSFATHTSTGEGISHRQSWIGNISAISKNTNNAIGGWEYTVVYTNGESNRHILEQDLRFIYQVGLKEGNTKLQNNAVLQQAFDYSKTKPNITLYLPKGNFLIGSDITESDLAFSSKDNYVILSSNVKLRGHDDGTKLIVDGMMLWLGLPTGSSGADGVSHLTIDNVHVEAKNLVNGDYFMVQMNHGNHLLVQNSSFVMVQRMSRHIFDLGGVQNATFRNNKFIGYAPSLTGVSSIPKGGNLHNFYAEAIQLDASNNSGVWDAQIIKMVDPIAYNRYNTSTSIESNNIVISNNQFLPYYHQGKLVAYSATVGQHSSQVRNVTITNNHFSKTLSKRYKVDPHNQWVMEAIHVPANPKAKRDISNNTIV